MTAVLQRFWNDESGQGLTEYALIIALVSVALIAALVVFRNQIGGVFDRMSTTLNGAPQGNYTPANP